MMDIQWQFDGDDTGGSVTAYYGRCRVTQYANGGIIATDPAGMTDEERVTRKALFARHARTGKIWVGEPELLPAKCKCGREL